jgi:hypothetical protein
MLSNRHSESTSSIFSYKELLDNSESKDVILSPTSLHSHTYSCPDTSFSTPPNKNFNLVHISDENASLQTKSSSSLHSLLSPSLSPSYDSL